MSTLTRRQLNERFVNTIQSSGWNVIFLNTIKSSPLRIHIYNETSRHQLIVYIWNITHGGATRSTNEFRIQFHVGIFDHEPNYQTIILGWDDANGIFGAFDYDKHRETLGKSPSAQIGLDAIRNAIVNGIAAHRRKNGEIAIAFRPDFMSAYINNVRDIHDSEGSDNITSLNTTLENRGMIEESQLVDLTEERKIAIRSISQRVRSASFQERVLNAYGYRCAFCDLQLNLIDAAHIIPVSESGSDQTRNGIALCSLHHRAYDSSLVTMIENYDIIVNENRSHYLASIHRGGGIEKFSSDLRTVMTVPPSDSDRPIAETIRHANSLRGWD